MNYELSDQKNPFAKKKKQLVSWEAYQKSHDRNPNVAQMAPLSKKEKLDLHANLARAESSLAV